MTDIVQAGVHDIGSTMMIPLNATDDVITSPRMQLHWTEFPTSYAVAREHLLASLISRSSNLRSIIHPPAAAAEAEKPASSPSTIPESVLANWLDLSRSGLSSKAYERLLSLAQLQDGWYGPGSDRLGADSIACFLRFWRTVKGQAKAPEFALTPTGHLQAEWHVSWRRHLEVEYYPEGIAFYLMLIGDGEYTGRDEAVQIASLLLANPASPLHWTSK